MKFDIDVYQDLQDFNRLLYLQIHDIKLGQAVPETSSQGVHSCGRRD